MDDQDYEPLPPDDPDLQRLGRETLDALRAGGTHVEEGTISLPPLSKRIIEIAHPLLDNADGDVEVQRLVLRLAVAAWNASLKPRGSRGDDFEFALRSVSGSNLLRVLTGATLELMICSKESLFPDDRRRVLNYEVREDDEHVMINVVAGLAAQDTPSRGSTRGGC